MQKTNYLATEFIVSVRCVLYLPGEAQPADSGVVQTQNHSKERQQVLLLLTAERSNRESVTYMTQPSWDVELFVRLMYLDPFQMICSVHQKVKEMLLHVPAVKTPIKMN